MTFSAKEKKIVGIAYVIFMVLFYFIGIPKQTLGGFVVSFLAVTAFFALCVFLVKKLYIDKIK